MGGKIAMHINHNRLMNDLRQLATYGKADTGVNRLSFTPEDQAARQWLLQQMTEAGLDAHIDGIGNVYGRTKGVQKAVLISSHTDSVPKGGWLDGAMGVLYGLEIARARIEAGMADQLGVDVISFADEEGTYRALAGSLSFCGELSEADIAVDADRYIAYLEGHIWKQKFRLLLLKRMEKKELLQSPKDSSVFRLPLWMPRLRLS
jgi:N-carbamoyl-L-amino-acid hydrolase